MKFKFTTQTCLVIAGLATTAYAACVYQQTATTTVCILSGNSVDLISTWPSTPTVYATADWNHGYQHGAFQALTSTTTVTSGNGAQMTSGQTPDFCYGPAKVMNPSTGTYETLSFWENNPSYVGVPPQPAFPSANHWGVTNNMACP